MSSFPWYMRYELGKGSRKSNINVVVMTACTNINNSSKNISTMMRKYGNDNDDEMMMK